jgi:hypothetical protein
VPHEPVAGAGSTSQTGRLAFHVAPSAQAEESPIGRTFAALRHRNFRVWAAADLLSITGTWMQVLGINWFILQLTGSVTAMGLSVLVQTLPVLFLAPWGGALADRLPARPFLLASQTAHAALAGALAVVAWSGHPRRSRCT